MPVLPADLHICCALAPSVCLCYYFLLAQVIILDFPLFVVKLTQTPLNDICCEHSQWTCWLFVAISSHFMQWLTPSAEWLPISWLIYCLISKNTYCIYPCIHIFFFAFLAGYFAAFNFFRIWFQSIPINVLCKLLFFKRQLVWYSCYNSPYTLEKLFVNWNSGIWHWHLRGFLQSQTLYCMTTDA